MTPGQALQLLQMVRDGLERASPPNSYHLMTEEYWRQISSALVFSSVLPLYQLCCLGEVQDLLSKLVRGRASSPMTMTLGSFPKCQSQLFYTHAFGITHSHLHHQEQLYCAALGEVQGPFS